MAIIQSNPYAPAAQPELRGAEVASRQAPLQGGQFQGERVVLASAAQSLADAAEELTFVFSERAELSLAKRKLSDSHARISEIEALVGDYLDKVPELERQQKIKEMVSHLGSGRLANLSQLLAYLESYSGEVSEQFEALCQARKALAGRPEMQGTLALVEQALAKLADEQGSAIVLGARITGPAAEAAKAGVGAEQDLRDLYRDAVQDYRAFCRLARYSQPLWQRCAGEGDRLHDEGPERRSRQPAALARPGQAGAGDERHAQAAVAQHPLGASGRAVATGEGGLGPWHTGLLI